MRTVKQPNVIPLAQALVPEGASRQTDPASAPETGATSKVNRPPAPAAAPAMGKAKVEALQRAKTTLKKGVKLNKLLKSIENHPKSKDAMVITLCKKIGLSIYLDKLGQDGRKKLLENVQLKSDERLKIMQEQEQAS